MSEEWEGCDRCGGSGEVLDHVEDGKPVTKTCPVCGGSGK